MKISTAIEDYLVSTSDHTPAKERKFYVSDMGKCQRMRFLKRKGVTSEFEVHVKWILKMGDLIHNYGYKALEAKGLLLEAEDYIENEHIRGRFDGIIKNKKKKSVFDFKSVGSWKMAKIFGGEDDEENIAQLLTAPMILKKTRKDISDSAFLVYINKDPGEGRGKITDVFFEREYHLTKWREKKIQTDMDSMIDFWLKDKIPPCTCPGWMKNYNAYQPLCEAKTAKLKKVLDYLKADKKVVTTKTNLVVIDGDKRKEIK